MKKMEILSDQQEELKKACHYSNLQPIWEVDHYDKTTQER